jgi:hypothetical protein
MFDKFCSICSKELDVFSEELAKDGTPACQVAKRAGLYCQKNGAGDYCAVRFASPDYQNLVNEVIPALADPNFTLSDEQCKKLDCCFYQETEFDSQTMGSGNMLEKLLSLTEKCATPVPKTCTQPSTIIL